MIMPENLSPALDVKDFITATVASILSVDREEVSPAEPLFDLGISSVQIVDLSQRIKDALGVSLDTAAFFEHNTCERLIRHIRQSLDQDKNGASAVMHRNAEVASPSREPERAAVSTPGVRHAIRAEDVAVIGVSCLLPGGIGDPHALWNLLDRGDNAVGRLPADRWQWPANIDPSGEHKGIDYGAFLEDVTRFDSHFFRISPKEASFMDPQQRLLLQLSWACLEDACYTATKLAGSRTGVFVGATGSDYRLRLTEQMMTQIDGHFHQGSSMAILPNRLSYFFDWKGPSMEIETACSSSLVAMHQAVKSLYLNECDQALVAGINIMCHPAKSISFYKAGMLSRDGRCKTFDKRADGYVRGEGAVVMLLRRLGDAVRDGDRIYGVIRGTAVNHGGQAAGLTVPNPAGQARLVRSALEAAAIDAGSISYVEAHGTGTSLGDPIEVRGLKEAYRSEPNPGAQQCGLGSIKTNFGHLEAAAGLAGVLKVLLAMRHKTLPATLNFQELNPHISLEGSPFYIVDKARNWELPDGQTVRSAGVNSFGAGGVNAHAVVQEYLPPLTQSSAQSYSNVPAIIVLSARTRNALQDRVKQMLAALSTWGWTDADLPSIAYSLQSGREAMEHRVGFLASTISEISQKLRSLAEGQNNAGGAVQGEVKQHKDALSIFDNDEDIQEAIQKWVERGKLFKVLELWVKGFPLDWSLLYGASKPALIALPTYPFRGEVYWLPNPSPEMVGAMPATRSYLHPLLHENTSDLEAQRFSSRFSGQEFFLAGHVIRGRKILPGVAYLEMARAAVERSTRKVDAWLELRGVVWQRPLLVEDQPVHAHIELYGEGQQEIRYEIFSKGEGETERVVHGEGRALQIPRGAVPLLDISGLQTLCSAGSVEREQCYEEFARLGLSYGPGHRSVRRLQTGTDDHGKAFVLGELELPLEVAESEGEYVLHPGVLDGALQASLELRMGNMGEKKKPGMPFTVERVRIYGGSGRRNWVFVREGNGSGEQVRKLDIDVCNERGEMWIRLEGFSDRAVAGAQKEAHEVANKGAVLLEQVWEEAGAEPIQSPSQDAELVVLLCGMEHAKHELEARIQAKLCDVLEGEIGGLQSCERDYAARARRLLAVTQEQMRQKSSRRVLLQLVVSGEGSDALSVGLWGFLKTAQLENPRLVPQIILLTDTKEIETVAAKLRENRQWGEAGIVRYQAGRREVARWKEILEPASAAEQAGHGEPDGALRAGGVYLITGGGGGLGLLFAEEVAKRAAGARIGLIGRSALGTEAAARLEQIRANGAEVDYWQADVCDRKDLEEVVERMHRSWGAIHGVIHCAGVIQDRFLLEKQVPEFEMVMGPKVHGLVNLDEVLGQERLEFLVMFSSGTASWGNVGQGDYAAANGFMDAYARHRADRVGTGERWGRTVSIGWPLWQDGGMKREPRLVEQMREKLGTEPLASEQGLEVFFRALASGRSHLVVVNGDRQRLRQTFLGRMQQPQPVRPIASSPANGATVATNSDIRVMAERYFKKVLAAVLRVAPEFIESDEPLADYGLDSIMVMEIIHQLEKSFGALSKTLLFETGTIDTLVDYFVEAHPAVLRRFLGIEEETPRPPLSQPEQQRANMAQTADEADSREPVVRFRIKSIAESDPAGHPFDAKPGPPPVETPHFSQANSHENGRGNGRGDIAIIGLSGRYPQALNLAEFWENLKAGKDCITEIPQTRWDYHPYFDPEKGKPGKSYSKWGGFIEGADEFDPLFFSISPREAESMDPQGRLFLQCAYETLEDAGYTRETLRRSRGSGLEGNVGVFVGVMYHEYQLFGAQAQALGEPFAISGSGASIANRVSYFCNFHGPSICLDSMCSSSLTAIHLACKSLQQNECELALAGGVNLALHPNKYLLLSQGQYVSSQGRCESFGEGGDGYVPGEGVGAVLLKPLDRAIADGDRIYAVIKASALNHGGRTTGYTVPNPNAQANVITQALQKSGLPASAVSYIEAHGTGTKLGDPIEIAGLSKAYGRAGADQPACSVGSVKSNIGHTESASGIAGLTKVLLQMKHKMLVPSLHAEILNPNIDFANTPFVVQRELQEWKQPVVTIAGASHRVPRTAAISSFGAGGANSHIIVQEYEAQEEAPNHTDNNGREGVMVVLSARTTEQLKLKAENLLHASLTLSDSDLQALGYTLQTGRETMECRLGILIHSLEDLRGKLGQFLSGASDIPGVSIGQAADGRDTMMLFTGDEDLQQGIESWIEKRKYSKLLDLWVKGLKFDWERLYQQTRPRRIGLPTYPFARERYWVSARKAQSPQVPRSSQNAGEPLSATPMAAKPSAISLKSLDQVPSFVPSASPATPQPPVVLRPPFESDPSPFPLKTTSLARGLESDLAESLAEVLYMEPSDVDIKKQFIDLGMDSVVGVEWVRTINRKYGLSIPAVRLYDYPTVGELAQFLNKELQGGNRGRNGASLSDTLRDVYQGKVSAGEAGDVLRDLLLHK